MVEDVSPLGPGVLPQEFCHETDVGYRQAKRLDARKTFLIGESWDFSS